MKNLRKLFGTDGIRGIANQDLTAELALKVGRAGAKYLGKTNRRGKIIVGRDPRPSGDFIQSALVAGILSSGQDVYSAGIISTPAVALLTRILDADGGIVISASHNPLDDNGIKFFAKGGTKLKDEQEKAVEDYIAQKDSSQNNYPTGTGVGRLYNLDDAPKIYLDYLSSRIKVDISGLSVVLDCANGALSQLAPEAFSRAGAKVTSFNTQISGENINKDCGSTHPQVLKSLVLESGADIGFSFDGDGDRVIVCDGRGRILDGDNIMAFCAVNMAREGCLKNNAVVTTVMANMGFDVAMETEKIAVYKTNVGDRYVLEKMIEVGSVFGGEQSGHIIFRDISPTGDALVSSLEFLRMITQTGYDINQLYKTIVRYPQVLKNVRVKDKKGVADSSVLKQKIAEIEQKLAGEVRIVVRPSGTEPVVRVMAEAKTLDIANQIADQLAAAISDYNNRA